MVYSGEFIKAYADSLPPLVTGLLITIIGGVIIARWALSLINVSKNKLLGID